MQVQSDMSVSEAESIKEGDSFQAAQFRNLHTLLVLVPILHLFGNCQVHNSMLVVVDYPRAGKMSAHFAQAAGLVMRVVRGSGVLLRKTRLVLVGLC